MNRLLSRLLAIGIALASFSLPGLTARAADTADNLQVLQLNPTGDWQTYQINFNSNSVGQDLEVGPLGLLVVNPVTKGNLTSSVIASGSAVSLVTATPKTVTSLTLGVGTWKVYGYIDYVLSAASTTLVQSGFGTTTNSFTNTLQAQDVSLNAANSLTTTSTTLTAATPWLQFTVTSGTQQVFMVAELTFSAGSATAYGSMFAVQSK